MTPHRAHLDAIGLPEAELRRHVHVATSSEPRSTLRPTLEAFVRPMHLIDAGPQGHGAVALVVRRVHDTQQGHDRCPLAILSRFDEVSRGVTYRQYL